MSISKRVSRTIYIFCLGSLALALRAEPSSAHAFGQPYNSPIPLWLYLLGAGLTVGLSFIISAFFLKEASRFYAPPRFNLLSLGIIRLFAHDHVLSGIRLLAVGMFIFLLVSGLIGAQSATKNIVSTMVWVIWWIGTAYVSALLGDVWPLLNPWRILFSWWEALRRKTTGISSSRQLLEYPPWLGHWPAILLFFVFAWLELVWEGSEIPRNVAALAIAYSLITWSGMIIFGKEIWLERGEVFTVIFGLFARFAPTAVATSGKNNNTASHEWNLRPYGAGLLTQNPVSFSMIVLVILVLATVTFDGFVETSAWEAVLESIGSSKALRPYLLKLEAGGVNLLGFIKTAFLLMFPASFLMLYLLVIWTMLVASSNRFRDADAGFNIPELAGFFSLSLVPIAIAYHLAHYLSYFLIAGQLTIPLASDPFGFGWDLFGTKGYLLRLDVINAKVLWFISVAAIVGGHVISVTLAHATALRVFRNPRNALRSQYPMIVLMIAFTMFSLWIIAQPIVVTKHP